MISCSAVRTHVSRYLLPGLLLVSAFPGSGCRRPADTPGPDVLAVFDGGEIHVADVDRVIRALPPAERKAQLASREQLERIVRALAFKRIMGREIGKADSSGDHYRDLIEDDVHRNVTVSMYLESKGLFEATTEDRLLQWAEDHPGIRKQEAGRLLYTFFLSAGPDRSLAACARKAEEIRKRVLSGESFPKLAEEYSESETRHRQGLLGWVSPGQLPPELDRVVSTLGEGEISEVITTSHGAHLFWVRTLVPGHTLSEKEVLAVAGGAAREEEIDDALVRALQKLGLSEPDLPPEESLGKLLRDPEQILLRIGPRSFSSGDCRFLFSRKDVSSGGGFPVFLRRLARMEAIRQAVREGCEIPEADIDKTVEMPLGAEILEYEVNRRMKEWLDSDEERLRAFYEGERARFQHPARYEILKLVIPFGNDPAERMRELEVFCADSGHGAKDLEELSRRFGGKLNRIPYAPLESFLPGNPGILGVLSLEAGELTPPHRIREHLVVYGLLGKTDPRPMSFEEARHHVVEALMEGQGTKLRDAFMLDVLSGADFEILPGRLEPDVFVKSLTFVE